MSAFTMPVATLTLLLMSVTLSQSQTTSLPNTAWDSTGGVGSTTHAPDIQNLASSSSNPTFMPNVDFAPTMMIGGATTSPNWNPNQFDSQGQRLFDMMNMLKGSGPMGFSGQTTSAPNFPSMTMPGTDPNIFSSFPSMQSGQSMGTNMANTHNSLSSQSIFNPLAGSNTMSSMKDLLGIVNAPSSPSNVANSGNVMGLGGKTQAFGILDSLMRGPGSSSHGAQQHPNSPVPAKNFPAELQRLIRELFGVVFKIYTLLSRHPIAKVFAPFLLQFFLTGEGLLKIFLKPVLNFMSF